MACWYDGLTLASTLQGFKFCVTEHQPFAALILEIHLHPGLGAGAFEVENGAFAEQRVAYTLAEAERRFRHAGAVEQRRAAHALAAARARHGVAQTYFLDKRRRHFADETRDLVMCLSPV